MADGTQTGFDVDAARKAGYSDDEILQHLTSSRNFDVAGATKAGYSTQEIIQHLSTTAAPKQQTAQATEPQTERAMQQSFGGPPMFVDVPKGEGQKFEAAGRAGYAQGAKTGLEMVGSAAGAEAADVSSLPSVVRGIVRILGAGVGAGAGNIVGQAGGTGTVNPEEAARTAENFAEYQTGGELLGAAGKGIGALRSYLGRVLYSPTGELTPLAKAITHPTQLPEMALRKVITPPEAVTAEAVPIEQSPYYMQWKEQTLAEKAKTRFEARKAAAEAKAVPITRSPAYDPEAYAAGRTGPPQTAPPLFPGSTPSNVPVGSAQLPSVQNPPGRPTPFGQPQLVSKFQPAAPSKIQSPETPAPPINKTYVSYSAADLVELARKGDLNAIRELIRNPRGIKLSDIPNVGYLMEPGRPGRVYGGPTGQ